MTIHAVSSDLFVSAVLFPRTHRQPSAEGLCITSMSGETYLPAAAEGPCHSQRSRLHRELCLSGAAITTAMKVHGC